MKSIYLIPLFILFSVLSIGLVEGVCVTPVENSSNYYNTSVELCSGTYYNATILANATYINISCNQTILVGTRGVSVGISSNTKAGVSVFGCTLNNWYRSIYMSGTSNSNIYNNIILNYSQDGIFLRGSNISVYNNRFENFNYTLVVGTYGSTNNTQGNGVTITTSSLSNNISIYSNNFTGMKYGIPINGNVSNVDIYQNNFNRNGNNGDALHLTLISSTVNNKNVTFRDNIINDGGADPINLLGDNIIVKNKPIQKVVSSS